MKKYLAIAVAMCSVATAHAALVGRDINGFAVAGSDASAVFLYDNVLNVTWLRNANAGAGSIYDNAGVDQFGTATTTTDGRMTWFNAVAWANSLNGSATVGGTTGWRLPTMIANPNTTFAYRALRRCLGCFASPPPRSRMADALWHWCTRCRSTSAQGELI
jgi:hypothetical protein